MNNKATFEYAIIRVVPKVEREEFFNVGVIVFSKPHKFLGIKYKINPIKLKAFTEEIEIDTLENYLKAWDDVCQGAPRGGKIGELDLADRFRWLTACRSTIIQSSSPHTGLTTNPENELKDLFWEFVLR
ncbi:DUF3037 domain-containing protein [Flavobacteriaceae bacterium F08102]|nr:DUF3037 domain-containing protein [Flavobacteriaceae bacterium F08102]